MRYRGPQARDPTTTAPARTATATGAGQTATGALGIDVHGAREHQAARIGGRGEGATPRKRYRSNGFSRSNSVVDRGFEDVTDEADDGATRRVPWTILKRTVADQQSGKPISAIYVLQRDGIDTEFANLGTARAAANKTIVHPEKLTLSKAEHAAAKK